MNFWEMLQATRGTEKIARRTIDTGFKGTCVRWDNEGKILYICSLDGTFISPSSKYWVDNEDLTATWEIIPSYRTCTQDEAFEALEQGKKVEARYNPQRDDDRWYRVDFGRAGHIVWHDNRDDLVIHPKRKWRIKE